MKITKDHVGKIVRMGLGATEYRVIHVDGDFFWGRALEDNSNHIIDSRQESLSVFGQWKVVEEKRFLAPAIWFDEMGNSFRLSDLYECESDSKRNLGKQFVKWPAIPNKDGFYEI